MTIGMEGMVSDMADKKRLEARVSGPVATSMALRRKAELAAKVNTLALTAAGVHSVGDVVSSEGWCSLPNGSTVHISHSECVKRGGIWSPARFIGNAGIGRGFGGGVGGEESPAHEAGENPTQETAEGEGGGSAPSAPSGGGTGGGA